MTEKDDKMLIAFFEKHAQPELADNGFTERVMRALPSSDYARMRRLNRVWTAVCAIAGCALIVLADGFAVFKGIVTDLFADAFSSIVSLDVSLASVFMGVLVFVTLAYVGVMNIVSSD